MTSAPMPSLCSFADVDPYTLGPPSVPLHPPPPPLPEDVLVCGGRQSSAAFRTFAMPAFAEDLLAIHLRTPVRMAVKLARWAQIDSVPGDFVLVPRGAASTWGNAGTPDALLVVLPPTLTRKIAWQDADRDPARVEFLPRIGHTDPLVHALGQAILGELQSGGFLGALYLETLFRTLALHLLRHHAVFATALASAHGQLSREAVRRVCDYIHAHLSQTITLAALAALVHLSPYHFARQFKAATGLPPYQYVLHCRVEQAKTLLMAGRHSISEVAQAVGFASQSHLTRHIRNAFGVTPRALLPAHKHRQP